MLVLVSLLAAASYGLADFVGGHTSKRVSAWTVAFAAQLAGSVVTGVVAVLVGGTPSRGDLAWAVLAGVGNGFGTAFLYRGLSSGRMGVVAPVSGVGAALIPVVAGVALGERPALMAWVGVLVAFPAIWLVSREPSARSSADGPMTASGLLDGVLAGVGFGALFVALSRVHHDAGLYPLALNQVVAGATIVVVATQLHQPWLPRQPRAAVGSVSGLLGALATGLFMLASRGGHLSLTAVVVSLYPAFTVILAAALLHERVHGAQAWGLALCAASVTLVAAG